MTYTIKPGSVVVAVRHDGQAEFKTVTKEKTYPSALKHEDYFVFGVRQPSVWKEFQALRSDVEVQVDLTSIDDGTYTVVFGPDTCYVTMKLETPQNEFRDDGSRNFFYGKQIVSYLAGPDNENNFRGFGHLDEFGALHLWKQFKASSAMQKYRDALIILQQGGAEKREEAGMAYAMKSGRCRKCNRALTVPASLHRGMGPVCSKGGTDEK